MSASKVYALDEESRQRMAAEVLELGEALFDLLLAHGVCEGDEAKSNAGSEKDAMSDAFRGAKEEFFTALRLLHDL